MAKSLFQVLDRLRPEEFEALKADIAERGCLVPVEVDEDGHVLDGHHRVEICDELGIRYKKLVRNFASKDDKIVHALKLNLLRRNLGPVAWAKAFRKMCGVRGVRLGSVVGRDIPDAGLLREAAENIVDRLVREPFGSNVATPGGLG